MKKKTLFVVLITFAIAVAVLLLLFANGIIVLDHSAQRRGDGVYWQGSLYVPCSGEYSEGKTIAKTEAGWHINEVKEDPSHTFIVLRSFLDQSLLVKEDYQIPTEGSVTSVVWGKQKIIDKVMEILEATHDEVEKTRL